MCSLSRQICQPHVCCLRTEGCDFHSGQDRDVRNMARKGKVAMTYHTRCHLTISQLFNERSCMQCTMTRIKCHFKRRPMQGYLVYMYMKAMSPPKYTVLYRSACLMYNVITFRTSPIISPKRHFESRPLLQFPPQTTTFQWSPILYMFSQSSRGRTGTE